MILETVTFTTNLHFLTILSHRNIYKYLYADLVPRKLAQLNDYITYLSVLDFQGMQSYLYVWDFQC